MISIESMATTTKYATLGGMSARSALAMLSTALWSLHLRKAQMSKRVEVKPGDRYGRLTAVDEAAPHGYYRRFNCRCECGQMVVVQLRNLRNLNTRSCGCLHSETAASTARESATTHGKSGTAMHGVWKAMKRRCYNQNAKDYSRYGGRGVRVCQNWRDSFAAFYDDMGDKPTPKHSVERDNNDGHYSCGQCSECIANNWPSNCYWATDEQQARNTRRNRFLTHDGKTMCVVEWADETGIGQKVICRRLKLGWTVNDTLTTPVGGRRTA